MRARPIAPAILCLALAACGGPAPSATSSPPQATATASPDIDATFDVGGRAMHLVCVGPIGTGEPTILLEAGGGGTTFSWGRVMTAMRETHRSCAYDRAGLGRSDPPDEASRTSSDQAADLRALLAAAGVDGPFILGAHSYGANVAILFVHAAPDDVAAVLFVDPQSPHVDERFLEALPPPEEGEPSAVTEFRGIDAFNDDPSQNPERVHLWPSFDAAAAALDAAGPFFGDRPVIVLTAGNNPGLTAGLPPELAATTYEIWIQAHEELAAESTAGSRTTVAGAGHEIQADQPAAVVEALERLLAAAMTGSS
jgi:pimeloyl-ACP methyl ester carboxylesterase